MSTVAEITEAIPRLTIEQLREVEQKLLLEYRERNAGIIFDDTYGALTGEDLRAIQEDAIRTIDGQHSTK